MAFVPASSPLLGTTSFSGSSVSHAPPPRVASWRMETEKKELEKESPVFGKAGKSQWKESYFTGGFPGGEAFFRSWQDGGMELDVPDMPKAMQAKAAYKAKKVVKSGVLAALDATEFFTGFSGGGDDEEDEDDEDDDKKSSPVDGEVADSEPPDPKLYEKYYPEKTRNLAPEITMVYENNFLKDRVSMRMAEVTASPTDVYFPKEMKNKAPIIDVSYFGNLKGASVSLRLGDVDGLPTLPPPPKAGDAVTELVPGSGGGLKLSYSVAGGGSVNI